MVSKTDTRGPALWQEGHHISFPPSASGGYNSNQDIPHLSVTSLWCQRLTLGVPMERAITAELSYEVLVMQMLASFCVPGNKCTRNIVTYPKPHVSCVVLRFTLGPKGQYLQWE